MVLGPYSKRRNPPKLSDTEVFEPGPTPSFSPPSWCSKKHGVPLLTASHWRAIVPGGQDISSPHLAPSYLFLRLSSRQMWLRNGDPFCPTPDCRMELCLGHRATEHWGPDCPCLCFHGGDSMPRETSWKDQRPLSPSFARDQLLEQGSGAWGATWKEMRHCLSRGMAQRFLSGKSR